MRILIANFDFNDDKHNIPFYKYLGLIRDHNADCSDITFRIFDPYGDENCTLGGAEHVFSFIRAGIYNGIISENNIIKDHYIGYDGNSSILVKAEILINPIYMSFLTQNTLITHMPQVPWDEFGNHIRLEGENAEQFMSLWNNFLRQNRDLYNAVYHLEYPLDECRSNIDYISMAKTMAGYV